MAEHDRMIDEKYPGLLLPTVTTLYRRVTACSTFGLKPLLSKPGCWRWRVMHAGVCLKDAA